MRFTLDGLVTAHFNTYIFLRCVNFGGVLVEIGKFGGVRTACYLRDDFQFGTMHSIGIEFSDIGTQSIRDAGITCVDDAVEKFIDEIDYWEDKVRGYDEDYKQIYRLQLEDPIALDYDDAYNRLYLRRVMACDTVRLLREDLEMLLGRAVPF